MHAMTYHVQYPLYFISKGSDLAVALGKLEESKAKMIPIFTDEDGALEFRDRYFPDWQLGAIPDEAWFAKLLGLYKDDLLLVAFDPLRLGLRTATIPINVMIEQLTQDPD